MSVEHLRCSARGSTNNRPDKSGRCGLGSAACGPRRGRRHYLHHYFIFNSLAGNFFANLAGGPPKLLGRMVGSPAQSFKCPRGPRGPPLCPFLTTAPRRGVVPARPGPARLRVRAISHVARQPRRALPGRDGAHGAAAALSSSPRRPLPPWPRRDSSRWPRPAPRHWHSQQRPPCNKVRSYNRSK